MMSYLHVLIGEVLSKKEFKSLTIIKTLRAKAIETEKTQQDLQRKLDKTLADNSEVQSKLVKVTDDNKQLNGKNLSSYFVWSCCMMQKIEKSDRL